MKYFFDTEFIERKGYLKLISIGITSEDGRDLYHVSTDFDPTQANEWVKEHVLPKLPPILPFGTVVGSMGSDNRVWLSEREIAERIRFFVGDDPAPEFWAYFADYDWVLFCWLFGTMLELPKGWPKFCRDLKQSMVERGIRRDQLPPAPDNAHDALVDARWLRDAHALVYRTPRTDAAERATLPDPREVEAATPNPYGGR